MVFTLPKLPYSYSALEPHIDKETMKIHHAKHHQAYVNSSNKVLGSQTKLQKLSAEEILKNLNGVPANVRTAVRNNVGGHVNHSFFWTVMGPNKGGQPSGEVADAIKSTFGSFENFKEEFSKAAATRFGSGWAWLVVNNGKLEVIGTPNQDSPLSEGKTPILCLDVWEHAYYLRYKNMRPKYIDAWWNVVNWDQVSKNFLQPKR